MTEQQPAEGQHHEVVFDESAGLADRMGAAQPAQPAQPVRDEPPAGEADGDDADGLPEPDLQ